MASSMAVCRSWGVVHAVDAARAKSEEYRRMQLNAGKHMDDVVPDVICRPQPIRPELSLNAEIPLVHVRGFVVIEFGSEISAEQTEHQILSRLQRKRISTRIASPGIAHVRGR